MRAQSAYAKPGANPCYEHCLRKPQRAFKKCVILRHKVCPFDWILIACGQFIFTEPLSPSKIIRMSSAGIAALSCGVLALRGRR